MQGIQKLVMLAAVTTPCGINVKMRVHRSTSLGVDKMAAVTSVGRHFEDKAGLSWSWVVLFMSAASMYMGGFNATLKME